jgi:hypothetical protein
MNSSKSYKGQGKHNLLNLSRLGILTTKLLKYFHHLYILPADFLYQSTHKNKQKYSNPRHTCSRMRKKKTSVSSPKSLLQCRFLGTLGHMSDVVQRLSPHLAIMSAKFRLQLPNGKAVFKLFVNFQRPTQCLNACGKKTLHKKLPTKECLYLNLT